MCFKKFADALDHAVTGILTNESLRKTSLKQDQHQLSLPLVGFILKMPEWNENGNPLKYI